MSVICEVEKGCAHTLSTSSDLLCFVFSQNTTENFRMGSSTAKAFYFIPMDPLFKANFCTTRLTDLVSFWGNEWINWRHCHAWSAVLCRERHRNSRKVCKFIIFRPNGDQIVGDFKNGRPHGKIVIKVAGNGTKIEGQFRHGMAHGLVRAFDGQRVVFEGLFRMGKAQGPGPAFIPRELQFTGLTI